MATAVREDFATQWIHMASDEWGSPLMKEIADDAFATHTGDKSRLLVEVHEHAGWYLAYAWIDGRVRCVESANDSAVFPPEVKAFWRAFNEGRKTLLPTIRRGE